MTKLLRRLVNLQDGETAATLWASAYFFSVLSSYYILRPLREEMGIAGGVENLRWLWTWTLAATLVAVALFSYVVKRWPRSTFVPVVYRFFNANLLIFFLFLQIKSPLLTAHVGKVFYVWLSVFNVFVVAVFWGFMADLFSSEQGKRLFGFIAVGGTLGAIAGSYLTVQLATTLGAVSLMVFAMILLEGAVFCVKRLDRITAGVSRQGDLAQQVIHSSGWSGIQRVFRSPYLLGICLYILLQSLASTFAYFEQARIVKESIDNPDARTALFATINLWVNALTLPVQIFLTGRIIALLGVGLTLALLPLCTAFGFAGLGLAPTLSVLVVFQVVRRASNYALSKPSREILYTVVSREEKYISKSFIDTFVRRGGDLLWAWAFEGLVVLGLGLSAIAFTAVPIAAAWAAVGVLLGRRHRQIELSSGNEKAKKKEVNSDDESNTS